MDVIRIDAVPYIWKELGTPCRNLKQVHTIVRMMRMIAEIVCPSVVLLGEVVMEPEKVVPYFGTVEKPECHMLYNVTTMATTWNSIATRDIRLLKKQMDIVNSLPKQYTFLNYLRCHDDIGWGLDFATLKDWGMDEPAHKRYLNDFFTGKHPGSDSRGELYNDDPVTQDARFCGTTASMCGIEAALFEKNDEKLERGIREDLMLHAYMLTQSGIPMLYSSDEVGRLNDYSYKDDPDKQRIPVISTAVLSSGILRKNGNQKLLLRARSSRLWTAWSRSAARNLFLTKTAMYILTMFMMTAFSASSARREMNVLSEFSTSVTGKNCMDAGEKNLP